MPNIEYVGDKHVNKRSRELGNYSWRVREREGKFHFNGIGEWCNHPHNTGLYVESVGENWHHHCICIVRGMRLGLIMGSVVWRPFSSIFRGQSWILSFMKCYIFKSTHEKASFFWWEIYILY